MNAGSTTLALPLDFSLLYGLALATLAEYQDAAPFDPSREDLGPYLDPGVQFLEEESQDAGEFHLIRPWLELLIASSNADIRALHIGRAQGIADIVLPHPGIDAMPIDEWHHVLDYLRQKLFHLDAPMTEEEKAQIKREVTITTESLDDFRARMRAGAPRRGPG